jgi:hypothetical protein
MFGLLTDIWRSVDHMASKGRYHGRDCLWCSYRAPPSNALALSHPSAHPTAPDYLISNNKVQKLALVVAESRTALVDATVAFLQKMYFFEVQCCGAACDAELERVCGTTGTGDMVMIFCFDPCRLDLLRSMRPGVSVTVVCDGWKSRLMPVVYALKRGTLLTCDSGNGDLDATVVIINSEAKGVVPKLRASLVHNSLRLDLLSLLHELGSCASISTNRGSRLSSHFFGLTNSD